MMFDGILTSFFVWNMSDDNQRRKIVDFKDNLIDTFV